MRVALIWQNGSSSAVSGVGGPGKILRAAASATIAGSTAGIEAVTVEGKVNAAVA